jgi:hypothetical protein
MRPRLLFIGLLMFLAYVLGARAGRPRYEQIKSSVTSFWNDPTVKKARVQTRKEAAKANKALKKKAKRRFG